MVLIIISRSSGLNLGSSTRISCVLIGSNRVAHWPDRQFHRIAFSAFQPSAENRPRITQISQIGWLLSDPTLTSDLTSRRRMLSDQLKKTSCGCDILTKSCPIRFL